MNFIEMYKKWRLYSKDKRVIRKYNKIAEKLKRDIDAMAIINQHSNKIFVCWFQGMENAPELVRICYQSLMYYSGGKEIILITEDNYSSYVDIPQYIMDKYNKGVISKTHFSDILRLELLIKYGGCWIDSTALLTAEIPDIVFNSDLFLFREFKEHTGKTVAISNWFICSCNGNKLLMLERALLYHYWSQHDKLYSYFLFHHFFVDIVIKKYSEEWDKVAIYPNSTPKVLDCNLFKPYDNKMYNLITESCFIHKLMYKYPKENFNMKNTFYDVLKKQFLV